MATNPDDVEDRHWSSLERRLTALETGSQAMLRDMADMRVDIKDLVETVQRRGQTNWSVLMAVGTLIVIIVGGFTTMVTGSITSIMERVEVRSSELSRDNRERVQLLDTNLQREMRDLDAVTRGRVEQLDIVLQREMRLLDSADEVAIAELNEDINEVRSELREVVHSRWTDTDQRHFEQELNQRIQRLEQYIVTNIRSNGG